MSDAKPAKATTNKPKTGRGGTKNFPAARFTPETDEDKALVGKLLKEVMVAYKQTPVKNDDALQERLDEYFRHCGENCITPTVEEMCLYTGYTSGYIYDIESGRRKGFSPETATIIKKAKEFMKSFDAKLVVAGKLNFLAYCFRAKNYYGMADKQEVVLSQGNPMGDPLSNEDLQKKYLEDAYGSATNPIIVDPVE